MSEETESLTPLKQFAYDLHQEVLVKCGDDNDPLLREDGFTEVVLELLAEHNEADGADVCYWRAGWRGRSPAAKVNAWALSGDGATLDLFVAYYHGDIETEAVTKADVELHYKYARGFLIRALAGFHTEVEESNRVFNVMRQIHEAKQTLTTVRLFFLTDGVVTSTAVDQEQVAGCEVRYVLWDMQKLSRLRVGERATIELNFVRDYGGAVPALLATDATGEYRTFLAYLRAPMLARIYGEYGQRLLERNVRAFLSTKGKVNNRLQKTLREEPHRFLAYNNGLCCTAAEVDLDPGQDGHVRLKKVRDFQIVNGGQTTASIYHAMKKERTDISNVVVQVKLSVLNDPKRVAEIVPLISQYANSQNKVNAADFSANGPYHQELERLSRMVWAPARSGLESGSQWYYERARGSYMDDKNREGTPARIKKWVKEHPPEQKFTKTDLAKYEHTWLGLPHFVCRGAEKNFVEFAQRQDDQGAPVVNRLYFERLIAKGILFKTAEKLFTSLGLVQFRSQAVAYALAWMADKSKQCIDLNRVWKDQKLPPGLYDGLSSVLAAAHGFLRLQSGNPGEAAKRAEVWREFRVREVDLNKTWEREWADTPFTEFHTDEELFASEWEQLRHKFINDPRTILAIETYTGRQWVRARRLHPVCQYAAKTWEELKQEPGLGLGKLRDLVQMLAAVT